MLDKTDQELAEETDNEAYFVRELAFEIWVLIAKYNKGLNFYKRLKMMLEIILPVLMTW